MWSVWRATVKSSENRVHLVKSQIILNIRASLLQNNANADLRHLTLVMLAGYKTAARLSYNHSYTSTVN